MCQTFAHRNLMNGQYQDYTLLDTWKYIICESRSAHLAYNAKLSYCLKPYIYLNMSPKVRKNTRRNGNANARMKRLMSKVRCWAVSSQIYFSGMAWSLWVRCSNGIGHETSTENNIGSVGSINPSQAGSLGSKLKYLMLDWMILVF